MLAASRHFSWGSIHRLERALALFRVVAWRVAYLRLGRTCPDLDARLFFDPDEIRSAYLLTKVRRPAQPNIALVTRRRRRRQLCITRWTEEESAQASERAETLEVLADLVDTRASAFAYSGLINRGRGSNQGGARNVDSLFQRGFVDFRCHPENSTF
jgi:hypothetical protein